MCTLNNNEIKRVLRFDGLDSVVIIKLVLCDADIISTDMDNNIRLIAVLVVLRNALAGDNLGD